MTTFSPLDKRGQLEYENNMRIPPLAIDPDTGFLDREVLAPRWFVPSGLELKDGRLFYSPFERESGIDVSGDAKRLLLDFVNLATASDDEIFGYARRFGVLGLCGQHNGSAGAPIGHSLGFERTGVFPGGPLRACHPRGWPKRCSEATHQWRTWSNTFGALLRLATALRTGKPGELEDWYRVTPKLKQDPGFLARHRQGFWAGLFDPLKDILDLAPRLLRWGIDAGSRRIEDRLKPDTMPVLRLVPISHYGALWVALSAELAFAASGSKGWSTCSDCGRMYPVRNKNLKFCTECGRAAAERAASHRYYQRHKDEVLKRRKGNEDGTQTQRR
ncbi:MAG: hypothetical protein ACLQU2_06135 [Candidatus Binataceae bacterium]